MKTTKLIDVADIIYGYAFNSKLFNTSGEGRPLIRIRDVNTGFSNTYTTENAPEKYLVRNGDFLIGMDGNFEIVKWANGEALLNQRVCKIIPKSIKPDYLFYLLSPILKSIENKTHSTTVKHLSAKELNKISFELPNGDQQSKIANELSNLHRMLTLKREALEGLDSLVKSRFIEMFGDKGFSEKPLAEYCFGNGAYGAQSASAPFQEGRPRYVRITDINDDGSLNDDVVCSINESDDMDYKLEYGDFLFARMGATVGKTYAFITGSQIYAGYCIRFKLDTSKINPRYLFWLTKQENYWRWVKENQSGAAQPGINAKKYGSLPVPNAPIDLQNQFASFVELIDKSRFDQGFQNA